jgi:hypothetical protein
VTFEVVEAYEEERGLRNWRNNFGKGPIVRGAVIQVSIPKPLDEL